MLVPPVLWEKSNLGVQVQAEFNSGYPSARC